MLTSSDLFYFHSVPNSLSLTLPVRNIMCPLPDHTPHPALTPPGNVGAWGGPIVPQVGIVCVAHNGITQCKRGPPTTTARRTMACFVPLRVQRRPTSAGRASSMTAWRRECLVTIMDVCITPCALSPVGPNTQESPTTGGVVVVVKWHHCHLQCYSCVSRRSNGNSRCSM